MSLTFVGHFVSASKKERKEIDEIVKEMKERGTEMRVKKRKK